MRLSTSTLSHMIRFVLVMVVALCVSAADNPEAIELKSNLLASAKRIRQLESDLDSQNKQLLQLKLAVASANTSVKEALEKYENIRSILAGIGSDAILNTESSEGLQKKLLDALAELKQLKENEANYNDKIERTLKEFEATQVKTFTPQDLREKLILTANHVGVRSKILNFKSDLGLVLIAVPETANVNPGAKVRFVSEGSGVTVEGIILDVREDTACVSLGFGHSLTTSQGDGWSVEFDLTNKL